MSHVSVPLEALRQQHGKHGEMLYLSARGLDPRPLIVHQQRKSVGAEVLPLPCLQLAFARCLWFGFAA